MYTIVWRYRVRAERVEQFERAYGVKGDRVRLFTGGEGYVGTRLYREVGVAHGYLTVDEWRSKADYDAFRAARAGEYDAIDHRCEGFTENEECLGAQEG
jgi:heme-degrading monooxygenase HmoA